MVALKRLRDATDKRSAQLLMQEFALLEQVKHRCIMRVFEYLHEENALVMEYVHGVTLRHILDDLEKNKSRFPSNAAINFGIEIYLLFCFIK